MNRVALTAFLLFFVLSGLFSFDIQNPVDLLGLKLEDIFLHETHPLEIYPHRGVEADEDTVVFYYEGGLYLFLHGKRIWQVRLDKTAETLPLNLSIGAGRSSVLARFLQEDLVPLSSGEDFVTFELRKIPWPVRVRLYFVNDRLDDLYLYRADF